MPRDIERILQSGFIAHLCKPVELKALLSAAHEAAMRHHRRAIRDFDGACHVR
jgi:hypothetical protein